MKPRRLRTAIVLVTVAALSAAWPTAAGAAPSDPSVRLLTPTDTVTLRRYGTRIQLPATTGDVVRDLPEEILDGWSGLASFLEVTVVNSEGTTIRQRSFTFCPNAWERQRIDDSGPEVQRYPYFCADWLLPFTKGMVWGIDAGWASPAFAWGDFGPPTLRLREGEYTFNVALGSAYADALEVAPEDAGGGFSPASS